MKTNSHPICFAIIFVMTVSACTSNFNFDVVPEGDPSCRGFPKKILRHGNGLALSGGGYRATLFHLGALRRLNELGLLHQMHEIASVSGGSIASAHVATFIQREHGGTLSLQIPAQQWENAIAKPLRDFTKEDIRTGPILNGRLLPWNWFDSSTAVRAMAGTFEEDLTGLKLRDLPDHPDFVYNATELSFGANWEMRKWRVGSYRTGYLHPVPEGWSLGRAVAASAAFPPVIDPMKVKVEAKEFKGYFWKREHGSSQPMAGQKPDPINDKCWKTDSWEKSMKDLRLSDGGVYDNLGVEPIWKDRKYLFVSDGGKPLPPEPDEGLLSRLQRWSSIMSDQAAAVRKRMLFQLAGETWNNEPAKAVFWSLEQGLDEKVEGAEGYSEDLAKNFLSYIRTDMDGFTEAERKVLENHGYLAADQALRRNKNHLTALTSCTSWPELEIPHPEWAPSKKNIECKIKNALVSGDHDCKVEAE